MTVSSIIPVNTYAGNSSTEKFDFDFLIEEETELLVEHINKDGVRNTLTLGVDYSINELGNKNGSYILFPIEGSTYERLREDEKIILMLSLAIEQESEFKNSSYFKLDILEWTFDYIVRILQILARKIDRCLKVDEGLSDSPDSILNQINEAKKTAINAANETLENNNLFVENFNEFNQKLNNFNEDYEDFNQSIIDSGIDTKSNVDLTNLSVTGEKHFLNKNQITNCILEAPKMVDLTLSNGTLTLASGAKVIVPFGTSVPTMSIGDSLNGGTIADISWDGSKLFYIVEYTTVITQTVINTGGAPVYLDAGGNMQSANPAQVFVSATAPTTSQVALWYDTTNNFVKYTGDSGATWYPYFSLPFAMVTANSSFVPISIDQVFQHIGYIGSIIWGMKGIKGLSPNGFNKDGTLKNVNWECNYVVTNSFIDTNYSVVMGGNWIFCPQKVNYLLDKNINWLEVENKQEGGALLGTVGKLNRVFQAIDYNDKEQIVNWGMPDYSAGVNIAAYSSSSNKYTCPCDGFISAVTTSHNGVGTLNINGEQFWQHSSDQWSRLLMSAFVSKEDKVYFTSIYDNKAKFYPLKGVN